MSGKMKECFTSHAMMHYLFGLGLGILVVVLIPSLGAAWLGLVLMAIAVIADSMRK